MNSTLVVVYIVVAMGTVILGGKYNDEVQAEVIEHSKNYVKEARYIGPFVSKYGEGYYFLYIAGDRRATLDAAQYLGKSAGQFETTYRPQGEEWFEPTETFNFETDDNFMAVMDKFEKLAAQDDNRVKFASYPNLTKSCHSFKTSFPARSPVQYKNVAVGIFVWREK